MKQTFSTFITSILILALLIPWQTVNGSLSQRSFSTNYPDSSVFYKTTVRINESADRERLQQLGITILDETFRSANIQVNSDQLEELARLGYQPQETRLLADVIAVQSPAIDSDADGLTDTQESWWCTGLLDPDSDADGITDGDEIRTLKDWVGNELDEPPFDTPWPNWPFNETTCPDKDHDSIPNLAERYELGTNMDLESTDGDKFDDGQEVFGVTNCPGGELSCNYGSFPRSEDSGIVLPNMPGWVEAPGNHPLVAAFPKPEIDVVKDSLHVLAVSTVTTDHVISSGTEKTYGTTETQGTSTSKTDTMTWNDWEEVSTTEYQYTSSLEQDYSRTAARKPAKAKTKTTVTQQISSGFSLADQILGFAEMPFKAWEIGTRYGEAINKGIYVGTRMILDARDGDGIQAPATYFEEYDEMEANQNLCTGNCGEGISGTDQEDGLCYQDTEGQNYVTGQSGKTIQSDGRTVTTNRFYPISYPTPPQLSASTTSSSGRSWGGSQSTTNTEYEEHSVTNAEAFSSEESWGNATAVDSAHAADFWFSYTISNSGTEYAREISGLIFNIYIGDDPNPAYTYSVSPDIGGDGKFHNFMPNEQHTYTARHIPLTLEQMKTIDTGGKIRVVVEDFSYGADELFYENAAARSVQIAIEDGVEDGDESINNYLIPTWGTETVLDVLARYFPHEVDEEGGLIAIWTPEYHEDDPSWCADSYRTGATLWCKHALSTAEWWNVYSSGLGDGSEGFQDTPAAPGGVALFRFNQDSDLDGYSDRSEERMGTDPADTASFPHPELLAGVYAGPKNAQNQVVATLSLLNMGLYDAYGVEAVMIAPDDSITITNNTVGGSGRVKAGNQVVVGSSISSPTLGVWTGTAKPLSGGYFTGAANRSYTFTVVCGIPGGCDVGSGSWSLNWADNAGGGAALTDFDSGYGSPNLLAVGSQGVKISFFSGKVYNGNTFTVQAATPRDTFQYIINREPHTAPVVIVSYNDPQGNHRFILPENTMALTAPTDNLAGFSGQMIQDPGVEIFTQELFLPGPNTTNLVVNNPSGKTLQNSHLFLEFIDPRGEVAAEVPVIQTLPPGPSTIPVTWDSASFSPTYDPGQDYIVLAFLTDYQGNILDTAGRPLSSFQQDPQASFAMPDADAEWNFGETAQNSLLQKTLTFTNQGQQELLTYVIAPQGLSVSQTGSQRISPADLARYTITLNTAGLPVGTYDQSISIRTSDPKHPLRTVRVIGTITAAPEDTAQGEVQRPMDYPATISGSHSQGEWVTFEHDLGPEPQSLHPVKVYSQDYSKLWGVGKYATEFASANIFGDGSDGPLTIAVNTMDIPIDSPCSGLFGSYVLAATNANFAAGQKILIHQTKGTNAGHYEQGEIASYTAGTITLKESLKATYTTGAQVLVLKEYTNVTVNSGVTWTAKPWNGTTGGILAFIANGTFTNNGTLNISGANGTSTSTNNSGGATSGAGFRGGNAAVAIDQYAWSGEGLFGGPAQEYEYYSYGEPGTDIAGGSTFTAWDGWYVHGGSGGNGSAGSGGSHTFGAWAAPGCEYGTPDLSTMVMGGGGAGGGCSPGKVAGGGGQGGGIAFIITSNFDNSNGIINLNGGNGGSGSSNDPNNGSGGSGGAGGSCLIKSQAAILGANNITARGGLGGSSGSGVPGGNGGVGRIAIQYQTISGETYPIATKIPRQYYIIEQIETSPYTAARLSLPESLADGHTFQIQYGRVLTFSNSGDQTTLLRLPGNALAISALDVLISGVGSGSLTFRMDVGNDGSWEWEYTGEVTEAVTLQSQQLSAAFNTYWASHGHPTSGTLDVPVRVSLDKPGQVLLANLKASSAPSTLRYLRLAAGNYSNVQISYTLSGISGAGAVGIDVGADGSVEDAWSGSPIYPHTVTSANLAAAVNTFLSGKSGEVDIPIRFSYAPNLTLALTSASANLSAKPDATLAAGDIHLPGGPVVEGDRITLSATVHNPGGTTAQPLVASFFATSPDWGDWYLGSALVSAIGPGGMADVSIEWNTEGFHGAVPVKIILDPTDRLAETSETNNTAAASLNILTRPDLQVDPITLSDNEPVVGQAVTVSLNTRNAGQTAASSAALRLYEGDAGTSIGEDDIVIPAAGDHTSAFTWTPSKPGWHRLTATSDAGQAVNEGDESNNSAWRDVYVGFAGPIQIDSGAAEKDLVYSSAAGFGVIEDTVTPDQTDACGTEAKDTYRRGPDGLVEYRFDHLLPGHFYHLDLTLYNCPGEPQRLENILVDGVRVAGPVDLSDNQVHRLSIRLDPALYADRQIIASIEAPGNIFGAVVNEINLHDIDYRYADSGGTNDPAYPGTQAFGYLDGSSSTVWGTLPAHSVRLDSVDNKISYRFDAVSPTKRYNVHLTFFQGNTAAQVALKVQLDGFDTGSTFYLNPNEKRPVTIAVPPAYYQDDSSFEVSVIRLDSKGPFVNEIALEEETLPVTGCGSVQATPYSTIAYGNVLINSSPAVVGTKIEALNTNGDLVGCFVTTKEGLYGYMPIYGEDVGSSPVIPGMKANEMVRFRVNGAPAFASTALYWQDDHAQHQVDLNLVPLSSQTITLKPGWNLIGFNLDLPWPSLPIVLQPIQGRFDRVLSETGFYSPAMQPQFNTLNELYPGKGYFIRVTGTTTITLMVEGRPLPPDSPISLHTGWNWISGPSTGMAPTQALASIQGKHQLVRSLDKVYDPARPEFSTMTEMRPGEGYQIYMSQAADLLYPQTGTNAAASLEKTESSSIDPACSEVHRTPASMMVFGIIDAGEQQVPPGTTIKVYSPRGELAGCALIDQEGRLPYMQVYGAYEAEPGFEVGEPLSFHINGHSVDMGSALFWYSDFQVEEAVLLLQPLDLPNHIFLPAIIGN